MFYFRKENLLTYEDLALLCDLFYLPFEHGAQGLQLLQEFQWLKSNAHIVISANQSNDKSNPEVWKQYWPRIVLLFCDKFCGCSFYDKYVKK